MCVYAATIINLVVLNKMNTQVLAVLGEVQRTWSHLESIFIVSEDIRKNLPEDAARFDKIDRDFKVYIYNKNIVFFNDKTGE